MNKLRFSLSKLELSKELTKVNSFTASTYYLSGHVVTLCMNPFPHCKVWSYSSSDGFKVVDEIVLPCCGDFCFAQKVVCEFIENRIDDHFVYHRSTYQDQIDFLVKYDDCNFLREVQ